MHIRVRPRTLLIDARLLTRIYINSRNRFIPADNNVGFQAGKAFVAHNIANLISDGDLNVKYYRICGETPDFQAHHCLQPLKLWRNQSSNAFCWLKYPEPIAIGYLRRLPLLRDGDSTQARMMIYSKWTYLIQRDWDVQEPYQKYCCSRELRKTPLFHVHGWVFNRQNGLLRDTHVKFEAIIEGSERVYRLLLIYTPNPKVR